MVIVIRDDQIQINGRWHQIVPYERINQIIQEFCHENSNFNEYLHEEILVNLDFTKIHWVIDQSLDVLGEAIPDADNSPPHFYCIILRRLPIFPEDTYLLAHEIGHCVYNEMNFPIVDPDRHLANDMQNYAKPIFNAFNSMIYDKPVNAKLKNYDIDLTLCIETNWPDVHIRNNYESIYRTFRYVIKRRSARLVFDSNPEYERALLYWYTENLPDIKHRGDEIFEIIERNSLDSAEEITHAIQQIASLFHWRINPMTNSIKIWIRSQA
jgi:hypothetical protein